MTVLVQMKENLYLLDNLSNRNSINNPLRKRARKEKNSASKKKQRLSEELESIEEQTEQQQIGEDINTRLNNREKTGRSLYHYFSTHGLDGASKEILNEPRTRRQTQIPLRFKN